MQCRSGNQNAEQKRMHFQFKLLLPIGQRNATLLLLNKNILNINVYKNCYLVYISDNVSKTSADYPYFTQNRHKN